ncbi:MAG TPA: hypothetical protein P5195_05715 [Anaerolineae bacterium]|nr:hypothetical protein [Anaerolineae bacterium]
MLDEGFQCKILIQLAQAYPKLVEIGQFLDLRDQRVRANLFHLEQCGMIGGEAGRCVLLPPQMRFAKITAAGLAFLKTQGVDVPTEADDVGRNAGSPDRPA